MLTLHCMELIAMESHGVRYENVGSEGQDDAGLDRSSPGKLIIVKMTASLSSGIIGGYMKRMAYT